MNLIVNGSDMQLEDDVTVADIVSKVAPLRAERGPAVAVNGEVVPKGSWASATLSHGDRVEVLHAIGGG